MSKSSYTYINPSTILVEDRQRTDLGDLEDLKDSIKQHGVIQPIIINQANRLVAGGRRLQACIELEIPVPYVFRETLSEDDLCLLELEENVRRKALTWQENCLAINKFHKLKSRQAALEGGKWLIEDTARALRVSIATIGYNKLVAQELITESKIGECENFSEAIRFYLRQKEDAAIAELAKRTLAKPIKVTEVIQTADVLKEARARYESNPHNTIPFEQYWEEKCDDERKHLDEAPLINLASMLFKGDSIAWMNSYLEEDSVDHVVTDPPYGIDMDMLNQNNPHGGMNDINRIEEEHVVESNELLFPLMFQSVFRILRPHGFFILWCDIMQWQNLYDLAILAGFKVQRWPITWVKTHQCINQAAQYNFTKNTEIAMVCRKSSLAILTTPAAGCTITCGSDKEMKELGNPFVKPFPLWEFIVRHISLQGQLIVDPFAGVGSGPLSFLRMNRRILACEVNDLHYNHLVENVKKFYTQTIPNSTFKV